MDEPILCCFRDGERLKEVYPTTVAHTSVLECARCKSTFVYDQSKKSLRFLGSTECSGPAAIRRLLLILIASAVLLPAVVHAQVCPPVTFFTSRPGDTIHFSLFVDALGDTVRVEIAPKASDGHTASDMRLISSNTCTRFPCQAATWEFETLLPDVSVWEEIVSGNVAGGWRCHLEGSIIRAVVAVPAPIPQDVKNRAKERTRQLQMWQVGTGVALAALCPHVGEPWCISLKVFLILMSVENLRQQGIVNDPWDDNYAVPYDPVFPSAPFWTGNQALDQLMGSGMYISMWAGFVTVSANRANSCSAVGDMNCAGWQTDRVRYGLRTLGFWQQYAATWMINIADELSSLGYDLAIAWDDTPVDDLLNDPEFFGELATLLMEQPTFNGVIAPAGQTGMLGALRAAAANLQEQGADNAAQ